MVGYLSAVAAALDARGVAVMTVRLDGRDPARLSGTLSLHPATARPGLGWGPTSASWSAWTGWSAELCGHPGSLTAVRYLHSAPVPSPAVAAEFVAALAEGRDVGMLAPVPVASRRTELITQLGRFAVPEPW